MKRVPARRPSMLGKTVAINSRKSEAFHWQFKRFRFSQSPHWALSFQVHETDSISIKDLFYLAIMNVFMNTIIIYLILRGLWSHHCRNSRTGAQDRGRCGDISLMKSSRSSRLDTGYRPELSSAAAAIHRSKACL